MLIENNQLSPADAARELGDTLTYTLHRDRDTGRMMLSLSGYRDRHAIKGGLHVTYRWTLDDAVRLGLGAWP